LDLCLVLFWNAFLELFPGLCKLLTRLLEEHFFHGSELC
jgi:hypothetical protein